MQAEPLHDRIGRESCLQIRFAGTTEPSQSPVSVLTNKSLFSGLTGSSCALRSDRPKHRSERGTESTAAHFDEGYSARRR